MKIDKIQTIVAEFAKANKISKAKAESFAMTVVAAVKPVGMGRKASGDTLEYRQKVEAALTSGKVAGQFTTNDLVAVVGGDQTLANNTLRYLKDTKGMVKQAGLKDKDAGQKGRSQVIWAM